ncbi:hypothetical protein LCGC14_0141630 [marine sediment metagenome]|uniref:Uncharacterized protein n=1 Tax=marine sediment metagenome TaxID=412755 RepID=A0A0F9Y2N9_9ZZZZ
MSTINVYVAETDVKIDIGEALGFYGGAGFGSPLSLNEANGRTFITDVAGTIAKEECDNCRKNSSSGVIIGQTGDGISLLNLPNYLTTINLRFTHPTAVLIQNARLIAFDGTTLTAAPTGLNIYGAETIHTSRLQTNTGTGDSTWTLMEGSSSSLNLVDSPGISGISPLGPASADTRHDWYVALSVIPTIPGDRNFSFRADLEYI